MEKYGRLIGSKGNQTGAGRVRANGTIGASDKQTNLLIALNRIRKNGYEIKLTEDGRVWKTVMFRENLARTERCKNQTGT